MIEKVEINEHPEYSTTRKPMFNVTLPTMVMSLPQIKTLGQMLRDVDCDAEAFEIFDWLDTAKAYYTQRIREKERK